METIRETNLEIRSGDSSVENLCKFEELEIQVGPTLVGASGFGVQTGP